MVWEQQCSQTTSHMACAQGPIGEGKRFSPNRLWCHFWSSVLRLCASPTLMDRVPEVDTEGRSP